MNCGRATFLDARNQIKRVIESFLLLQKWRFGIPNLGVVSPVQEKEIVMCDVLDDTNNFSQFNLGCAQKLLTVIQDCTLLHDIYNS
jgi:hypothetical protein